MQKHLRLVFIAAAVLALAGLAAGCGSKKSSSSNNASTTTTSSSSSGSAVNIVGSYDNGTPAKGGVWRVGVEQSFGFTNNFDPTGEYLGTGINIYENLMLRGLMG